MGSPPPKATKLLTVKAVAALTHQSERNVRLKARRGNFEGAHRVGGDGKWLIPREAILPQEQVTVAEALISGPPAGVVEDAWKKHYERVHELVRQLEVGARGTIGESTRDIWPKWPFRDLMPPYLKGRLFTDAVLDGHSSFSTLSTLYTRWENVRWEADKAAEDSDRLAYAAAHDELTDNRKRVALEYEALDLMEIVHGHCRFCPGV